jgi:proline iminopeptidase
MTDNLRPLYPANAPFATHRLKVSALHEIYVAEYGNPKGIPVVVLHGGPGAGISPTMSRFHDPAVYHMVTFDQRGCGRSTPYAELEENTTWHLVDDIETIRQHLGIDKWQVFGGSWGSTLALAYAETHPDRVTSLVVRGIFTLRRREIQWFYQDGASFLLPEAFADYVKPIPVEERGDMVAAYYKRLTGADEPTRLAAARAWSMWEGASLSLIPDPGRVSAFGQPHYALAFARIECHYFQNGGFLQRDDQLLADAGKLADIPGTIVHGRYDLGTPIESAWLLHQAWPRADFRVAEASGHAMTEAGIIHELVGATRKHAGQ